MSSTFRPITPKSTIGNPTYGPYPDGTVQTYFRYTPVHRSSSGKMEVDLYLMKPSIPKDVKIKKWHDV